MVVVTEDPALLVVSPVSAGSCEEESEPLTSLKAGCVEAGNPPVETLLIHWCDGAVKDLTPPSVEPVGLGRTDGVSVPLVIFEALVASVVAERASPVTFAAGMEEVGCKAFTMRESFPAATVPARVPILAERAPLLPTVSPELAGTITPPSVALPAGCKVLLPMTLHALGWVQAKILAPAAAELLKNSCPSWQVAGSAVPTETGLVKVKFEKSGLRDCEFKLTAVDV